MKSANEKALYLTTRRAFIKGMGATACASLIISSPLIALAEEMTSRKDLTIQEVINIILKSIPGAPFKQTVDTVKSSVGDQKVTGIITTSFATVEVIERAIKSGANFIIVHEPTFYNHADETDWLEENPVYRSKRELLEKHKIVVWRFHDYWHSHRPDGVMKGVLKSLDWEQYQDNEKKFLINVPGSSVKQIVSHLKHKLQISHLRMIGDLNQECRKVVLLPGASGGRTHIRTWQQENPDLIVVGELQEWETSEFIRDARELGHKTSLVILGHAVSEEPGMKWLVDWLQPKIPGIEVTHIAAKDPFTWL